MPRKIFANRIHVASDLKHHSFFIIPKLIHRTENNTLACWQRHKTLSQTRITFSMSGLGEGTVSETYRGKAAVNLLPAERNMAPAEIQRKLCTMHERPSALTIVAVTDYNWALSWSRVLDGGRGAVSTQTKPRHNVVQQGVDRSRAADYRVHEHSIERPGLDSLMNGKRGRVVAASRTVHRKKTLSFFSSTDTLVR